MKLKLNKQFYNLEAVKEALSDFSKICDGKIINESIEIELIPKEDSKFLAEEFSNYVLGLMKNKSLV